MNNGVLSDDGLGVMKFAASQCVVQLAMFGSLGGEQFYAAMREGLDPGDAEKTERLIGAIKTITDVMGGEGFGPGLVQSAMRTQDEMQESCESLLDVYDVSRILNVDSRTISRWVKQNKFPAPVQLGRLVRWKASTVSDWIKTSQKSEVP